MDQDKSVNILLSDGSLDCQILGVSLDDAESHGRPAVHLDEHVLGAFPRADERVV